MNRDDEDRPATLMDLLRVAEEARLEEAERTYPEELDDDFEERDAWLIGTPRETREPITFP